MRLRVVLGLTSGILSGVDVFSCALARALRQRGIDAHLMLTEAPEDNRWPLPLPDDVPIVRLDTNPSTKMHVVRRHITRCAPCIYIPNYDIGASAAAVRLPDSASVVGIVHSDDPFHYRHARRFGRYWDAVVAVSSHVADSTAAIAPDLASRMVVIPYGVAIPAPVLRTAGGPLKVIYAGRIEQHQKRVLDLPEVFASLRMHGVDATLTIVGDGPELPALRQRIGECSLTDRVTIVPTVANAEVLSLFDRHDVFALPSAFEGLPVALLEAMAHGCVPVVSDVASGIPDVVRNGRNGLRVPIGDTAAFAAAISGLARSPELLRDLSSAARATVAQRYTTGLMTDRYLELFDSLLDQGGVRRFDRPRPTLAASAHATASSAYYAVRAWGRRALIAAERTQ